VVVGADIVLGLVEEAVVVWIDSVVGAVNEVGAVDVVGDVDAAAELFEEDFEEDDDLKTFNIFFMEWDITIGLYELDERTVGGAIDSFQR
jgi:hypothetical protein